MSDELKTYISTEIPGLATVLGAKLSEIAGITIPFETLVQLLSDYETETEEFKLELSKTRPDYESIKAQFQARLRQKDSWRDLIQAGVGETILEFVASIGDYGQTSILRAYQETSFDARLTSSVYTITRILGVHIERKIPAKTTVKLWGDTADSLGDLAIPSMSQLNVGGIPFFNRKTIVFNNNTEDDPLEVELYQGSVAIENFLSFGTPYQSIELGQNDYRVSDIDVYCYVDGTDPYKAITDGLWHYNKNQKVFFQNTTPNGNVEVLLGNNVFGKIPENGRTLNFIYALTDGAAANTTQTGKTVSLIDINDLVPDRIRNNNPDVVEAQIAQLKSNLQGITTTAIYDGGDERDAEFYKAVAPGIRAANKRIVTRPDHKALGLKFPNVVDVYFQGQRELGRTRPSFMNIVGVTVLKRDGTIMSSIEWADYVKYLTSLEIWRADFYRIDPEPIDFDVYGDLYCTRDSNKTNVGTWARHSVQEFFKPQLGSLGKSVFENDVETMLKVKYGDIRVDYVRNASPMTDTLLTKIQWPRLRTFDCAVHDSDRNYRSVPPRIL